MRPWRKAWKQRVKALLEVSRVADIPTSFVVWHGASLLDGAHVMAVATCVREVSQNGKVGDAINVGIYRVDQSPYDAWTSEDIRSICPDSCQHRSDKHGDCYVNWGRLTASWAGARERLDIQPPAGFWSGAKVRFGMAGDPAAVPLHIWEGIASECRGWMGYTAHWRELSREWSHIFMASVSNRVDFKRAEEANWRAYWATEDSASDTIAEDLGVRACLSHSHGLECIACLGCDGTRLNNASKRASFYNPLHGLVGAKRRKDADVAS